ncbi:hypothetical protein HX744_26580 [Pseudonocardia sp. ICBG1122]|nr:hypothetical protein [Pseudonocardia pini]
MSGRCEYLELDWGEPAEAVADAAAWFGTTAHAMQQHVEGRSDTGPAWRETTNPGNAGLEEIWNEVKDGPHGTLGATMTRRTVRHLFLRLGNDRVLAVSLSSGAMSWATGSSDDTDMTETTFKPNVADGTVIRAIVLRPEDLPENPTSPRLQASSSLSAGRELSPVTGPYTNLTNTLEPGDPLPTVTGTPRFPSANLPSTGKRGKKQLARMLGYWVDNFTGPTGIQELQQQLHNIINEWVASPRNHGFLATYWGRGPAAWETLITEVKKLAPGSAVVVTVASKDDKNVT